LAETHQLKEEIAMDSDEWHRKETREKMFHSGIWLTELSIDSKCARQWEVEKRIFAVVYNDVKYYAGYQFDEDGAPLTIVKEVLQHLRCNDPWSVAAWFYFPNSWIANGATPVPPKDALNRQHDVITAAIRSTGTYIA
jgi:hypothetical protein